MTQPPPGGGPPYGAPPPGEPSGGGYDYYGGQGGYGGYPPPGYGQPYGYPYGQPGHWPPPMYLGPPGRVRPTGTAILLFFVTFGIYGFVYNYQVHSEMKGHSGRGIGGGIALLLTFLAGIAMPFITPMEIAGLYALRGQRPPVNGWTGLWYLVPSFAGYFLLWVPLLAISVASANDSISAGAAVLLVLVWVAASIAGGVIWFVKTNDALNQYWQSLGVR